LRTRDLDQAIEAVAKVYCPHTVEVAGSGRNIDASLEVSYRTFQPLVELSYSVPVKIDAGDFPRLFLVMQCARGSAGTRQQSREAEWRDGETMPFSAGFDTQLWFDRSFAQKSIRLDADKLETLCARWLGHPLAQPLRFALQPFSPDLERIWRNTLTYLWSTEPLPLSDAAKAALDEFVLTLVLHQHPHNHSEELAKSTPAPAPGLVRRAERYMIDNAAEPITVSDVAAHLGTSLRSLQAGFRQWRATTPNAFLRQVRLQRVRDELLHPRADSSVTTAALRYGFPHLGRFSAYYQSAFGETPSETIRRSRAMSAGRNAGSSRAER